MNDLMLFKGRQVRTVIAKDGNAFFHAQDTGAILAIADVKSTIRNYGAKHKVLLTNSKVQDMHFRNFDEPLHNTGEAFLTEAGVYKLSFRSPKEEAEEFTDWVTSELLPTVRKTGAYITSKADPKELREKADKIESLYNTTLAAKQITELCRAAGMKDIHILMAVKMVYRKAGIELPVIELKANRELFGAEDMAKMLGVYSSSGLPHKTAIGAILTKIEIADDEKELIHFEKNGYDDTHYCYSESVVERVRQWLQSNNYPCVIKGPKQKYNVSYRPETA